MSSERKRRKKILKELLAGSGEPLNLALAFTDVRKKFVNKVKRKQSKSMEKLLAEAYRKRSKEDLRLAKEFAKECEGSGSDKL